LIETSFSSVDALVLPLLQEWIKMAIMTAMRITTTASTMDLFINPRVNIFFTIPSFADSLLTIDETASRLGALNDAGGLAEAPVEVPAEGSHGKMEGDCRRVDVHTLHRTGNAGCMDHRRSNSARVGMTPDTLSADKPHTQ
jgi:hypothetical protein